ncbi:hypothetical protein F5J12DRAFT_718970 [Pisolithus orientalis]|uniref:uncharacterized protein n=1 Tax=Pisolithus orientalis TaxID=936130 RepID=UPI002224DF27|nr:uncharacterized protein F5J12DRAFT_718970 [Pisolithus orientalis]KAI6009586.1 hypothetical protein F5J12DRAFT_718970 [Pisolithus orientalis]
MSQSHTDAMQQWINEAMTGMGIQGSFSTHCFRWGGAQYRFMLAPVGKCWSLKKVHWWGGWAEGEHVSAKFECPIVHSIDLDASHLVLYY